MHAGGGDDADVLRCYRLLVCVENNATGGDVLESGRCGRVDAAVSKVVVVVAAAVVVLYSNTATELTVPAVCMQSDDIK
jgi:hypothetical protein